MDHIDILLGELREFKRATLDRLSEIEKKVTAVHSFQSKLIGMATLSAFIATAIVEFLRGK